MNRYSINPTTILKEQLTTILISLTISMSICWGKRSLILHKRKLLFRKSIRPMKLHSPNKHLRLLCLCSLKSQRICILMLKLFIIYFQWSINFVRLIIKSRLMLKKCLQSIFHLNTKTWILLFLEASHYRFFGSICIITKTIETLFILIQLKESLINYQKGVHQHMWIV